jgi:hypothetical protein
MTPFTLPENEKRVQPRTTDGDTTDIEVDVGADDSQRGGPNGD